MDDTNTETGDTSRWTPELITQAFKELVTAVLGLLLVAYTLFAAGKTLTYVGDQTKVSDAKDILLLLLGLAGVVLGYYFGRVPADARAVQAQQQANSADARAEQVSSQAEAAADQVEQIVARMVTPGSDGTRSPSTDNGTRGVVDELQQLHDKLRQAAGDGRRR